MENLKDLYKQLIAKFPDEAISKDTSRGFELTSVKAQYVVERLNNVFGFNGWELNGEFKDTEGGVLFLGNLHIKSLDHAVQTVGFGKSAKIAGDAYKAARTDALSKAASWIGVGNEIFKGQGNVEQIDPEPDEKYDSTNEIHRKFLHKLLLQCGIKDREAMIAYAEGAVREELAIGDLETFIRGK